jgi:hypothetical protein
MASCAAVSMPFFQRYVGIDYSGAETPDASLKGLRVYVATQVDTPVEELPPAGAELLENWHRARQHLPLVPIAPLEP